LAAPYVKPILHGETERDLLLPRRSTPTFPAPLIARADEVIEQGGGAVGMVPSAHFRLGRGTVTSTHLRRLAVFFLP
jgi:hypothetical protein